jgi:hypothetical protein
MAIEEEVALRHYKTGEKVIVKAIRTSREGEYITNCINPDHPDKHPSMGINIIKGVYNCISRQDASGITWEKYLEGNSKASKKSPGKIAKEETKRDILMGVSTDLINWEGYDETMREEAKARQVFDLCILSESERVEPIDSLAAGGIFRKSDLKDRIKKVDVIFGRYKKIAKAERKEKKVRIQTLLPGLIHLIKEEEKVSYLMQLDGQFYREEIHELGEGVSCQPKQELPYHHCKVDILKMDREVNLPGLLKDIENYIRGALELPDGKDYFLLALWVFHTYTMEKFNTTPFIYFYGVFASGKSRGGEILIDLSFRGWSMTSPTEASLFRPIQYYEPTIHLDHVRFFGSETNQAVKLLLQSRYKRGLKVVRNDLLKPGEEGVNLYNVFGATIISSEDTISGALNSRSITFVMKQNISRRVEKIFFDKEKAKSIRDRLTIFRANYESKNLAEAFPSIARRRLAEILYPLNRILATVDPGRRREFEETVKKIQGEVTEEISISIDSEIVNCLVSYYNETKELTILSNILTDKVNMGKPENEKYKTNYISRIGRKLTFKRKLFREHNSRSGFILDLNLLEELSKKYDTTKIVKDTVYQSHVIFPA